MGHAWPAGSGPGGEQNFIASRGLSYPAYLTAFLTSNNRRLAAPAPPPQLTAEVVVDDEAATIEIRGEAGVDDGALDEITVELAGLSDPAFRLGPVEVEQPSPPAFSWTSDPLPASASYRATVRARADEAEAVAELVFGIGLDAPFPPVLGEVVSSVDQGCLTMFGPVRDDNGDLDRVTVAIDGGPARDALLNAARDSWTLAELCTLEPGQHAVVVTAFDLAGLEGQPVQLDVEIPVPFVTVTDTLGGHVAAQRIRFYFEAGHFGSVDVPFTTLLMEHGSLTPFPLHGINDRFFAVRPGTAIAGGPISAIVPAAGARSEMTLPASAALAEALNALMASGREVSITISPPRGR
jgi:hypothetical protein